LVIVQPPVAPLSNESGPSSPNAAVHRRAPVIIEQVIDDQVFVHSVKTFDTMLQAGTLLDYCDQQINSTMNSSDEQIIWRFLRASFELDPRNHYIELLGFRRDEILQRIASLTSGGDDDNNNNNNNDNSKSQSTVDGINSLHIGDSQTKTKTSAGNVRRCCSEGDDRFRVSVLG
jgi:hypothetical protein